MDIYQVADPETATFFFPECVEDVVDGNMAPGVGPVTANGHEIVSISQNGSSVVQVGYQFRHRCDVAPVLMQQVPSRGLSFQLWPAAEALCWWLEEGAAPQQPITAGQVAQSSAQGEPMGERDPMAKGPILPSQVAAPFSQAVSSPQAGTAPIGEAQQGGGRPTEVCQLASSGSTGEASDPTVTSQLACLAGTRSESPSPALCQVASADSGPLHGRAQASSSPLLGCQVASRPTRDCHGSSGLLERAGRAMLARERSDVGSAAWGGLLDLRGKRVLELGAGTGLAGMVAARLGAHVVLTDLPQVMENLTENVRLNWDEVHQGGGSIETRVLRWGVEGDVTDIVGNFDIILGADVVYYDTLFEPLLKTLNWLVPRKHSRGQTKHVNGNVEDVESSHVCKRDGSDGSRSSNTGAIGDPTLDQMSLTSRVRVRIRSGSDEDLVNSSTLAKDRMNGCIGELNKGFSLHLDGHEETIDFLKDSGSTDISKNKLLADASIPKEGKLVLLAHMRRWKKDGKFFKAASKHFNVRLVHTHEAPNGARKGVEIYSLTTR